MKGASAMRVGAEIHLAVAIADGERRAFARPDEEIVLAREQEGEREGAAQARQHRRHRVDRRAAAFSSPRSQDGRRPRCRFPSRI